MIIGFIHIFAPPVRVLESSNGFSSAGGREWNGFEIAFENVTVLGTGYLLAELKRFLPHLTRCLAGITFQLKRPRHQFMGIGNVEILQLILVATRSGRAFFAHA